MSTPHSPTPSSAGTSVPAVPPASPDFGDEDLSAILDERLRRQRAASRRGLLMFWGCCGALMLAAGVAYHVSPGAKAKVDGLVANLMYLGRDLRTATDANKMAKAYDESLKKIAARNATVNDATASLGVDPSTVDESNQGEIEKQVLGADAAVSSNRNQQLQRKFGEVAKRVQQQSAPPAAPAAPAPAAAHAPADAPQGGEQAPLIIR